MTDEAEVERIGLRNAIAAKLLGTVNAPEDEIFRVSSEIAALAAAPQPPAGGEARSQLEAEYWEATKHLDTPQRADAEDVERVAVDAAMKAEIAKYTGHRRSDDDLRCALNLMRTAVLAALQPAREGRE